MDGAEFENCIDFHQKTFTKAHIGYLISNLLAKGQVCPTSSRSDLTPCEGKGGIWGQGAGLAGNKTTCTCKY